MARFDVLLVDGVSPSALGITLDVAKAANRIAGREVLSPRLLSTGDRIVTRGGLVAMTTPIARRKASALIVAPGAGAATEEEVDAFRARPDCIEIARWLARADPSVSVFASCTGVLLLAMAGLTRGRACTTTWWLAPALQTRYPESRVEVASMIVRDERITTAGASLAHVDLMLALVAHEGGAVLAQETARRLVFDQRSSQARYIIPAHLAAKDDLVQQFDSYLRARITHAPSMENAAGALGLAPRTFTRRIKAATGLSPIQFLHHVRLDVAHHLIATTDMTRDDVARHVGLADASSLYRLFKRIG